MHPEVPPSAAAAAAAPAVAVAVTPAGAFFGFIGEAAQPAAASVQASAAFSVQSKVLSRLASILMKRLQACTARATRTECRLLATGSASGAFSICACTFTVKMACGTSASEVLGHEPTDMADGPRTWLMRIPSDAWVPRVLVADSTDVGGVRSAGQCEARQRRRDSGGVRCARSSAKFTLPPQTLIA